jgi:hypothetical protein
MAPVTAFPALDPKAAAVAEELRDAVPFAKAAPLLRRSPSALYHDKAMGLLRTLKVGNKIFLPKAELERLLLAASA